MPAVSKDQRVAMAIAEHAPGQLYARNKGLLKMSKSQLHDFAATKEKGLPKKVKQKKSSGPASAQSAQHGATAPLSQAMHARKR